MGSISLGEPRAITVAYELPENNRSGPVVQVRPVAQDGWPHSGSLMKIEEFPELDQETIRFSDLEAGKYFVLVSDFSIARQAFTVDTTEGEAEIEVDLRAGTTVMLSGRYREPGSRFVVVRDAEGRPLFLEALFEDQAFRLTLLPGRYRIEVADGDTGRSLGSRSFEVDERVVELDIG